MAVAEKRPTEVQTPSVFDRAQVVSLIGVLYVIASLAILFKLVPSLCLSLAGAMALNVFVSYTFVGVAVLAAGVALAILGARLLGPNPPAGVRAGIFVGLLYLLTVVLLTRWVSMWVEYWVYYEGWFHDSGRTIGMAIVALAGVGLLFLTFRWFMKPRTANVLVALESAGWFSVTPYKPQQGRKVRQGTIIGLMILFLSGVWTMYTHKILQNSNWEIGIPFTGITRDIHAGDARSELDKKFSAPEEKSLGFLLDPEASNCRISHVFVGSPAWAAGLKDGDLVTKLDGKDVANPQDLQRSIREMSPGEPVSVTARVDNKETTFKMKVGELYAWQTRGVPSYEFRNIVAEYDPSKYVRIDSANNVVVTYKVGPESDGKTETKTFTPNQKVPKSEIAEIKKNLVPDSENKLLDQEEAKKLGRRAVVVPSSPPVGTMELSTITLLPHVRITVLVLLAALAGWFSWRVVNVPSFADFLIATEAELNKVSWTTRKRLLQDTIVVLTTMVLLAMLLFAMDQVWLHLLSWKRIGVIYQDDNQSQTTKGERPNW